MFLFLIILNVIIGSIHWYSLRQQFPQFCPDKLYIGSRYLQICHVQYILYRGIYGVSKQGLLHVCGVQINMYINHQLLFFRQRFLLIKLEPGTLYTSVHFSTWHTVHQCKLQYLAHSILVYTLVPGTLTLVYTLVPGTQFTCVHFSTWSSHCIFIDKIREL